MVNTENLLDTLSKLQSKIDALEVDADLAARARRVSLSSSVAIISTLDEVAARASAALTYARKERGKLLFEVITSGKKIPRSVFTLIPTWSVRFENAWGKVGETLSRADSALNEVSDSYGGVLPVFLTSLLGDHWSRAQWPWGFINKQDMRNHDYCAWRLEQSVLGLRGVEWLYKVGDKGFPQVHYSSHTGITTISLYTTIGLSDILEPWQTEEGQSLGGICYFRLGVKPSEYVKEFKVDTGLWNDTRMEHVCRSILPALAVCGVDVSLVTDLIWESTRYRSLSSCTKFYADLSQWSENPHPGKEEYE